MTDICHLFIGHAWPMLIGIRVEQTRPLSGQITAPDRPDAPFAGWLDLLGALSELIEPAPLGGRDEFDARGHAELGQHPGHVVPHGSPGLEQALGDLGIR